MRVEAFCLFLSFYLRGADIVNNHIHLAGEHTVNYIGVIWNTSEWKYSYICDSSDRKEDFKLAEKSGKEL